MFKKTPPYQIIALAGSVLLAVYVYWAYKIQGGDFPDWTFTVATVLSGIVAVMTLLGLWQLYSDFQKGYLFPVRNATLFLTAFSVVALPLLLAYEWVKPTSLHPSTLLLLPVFLFLISRNLFRIKIDNVALEAKVGFGKPTYIPLFNITLVTEDESGMTISHNGGKDIRLMRMFFFASTWGRLKERVEQLG